MQWEDLPEIEEVRSALYLQAQTKAKLKAAKLTLEIYQAELVKQKQRDPSVKLVGIDDESKHRLRGLLDAVLQLEAELDMVDADVKFHDYRRDCAKTMSYKNRG